MNVPVNRTVVPLVSYCVVAVAVFCIPVSVRANAFDWTGVSFDPYEVNIGNSRFVDTGPDGTHAVSVRNGGGVFVTADGGTTWTETDPVAGEGLAWETASVSADGSRIVVGSWNGRLYRSVNGGMSWSETGPTVGEDQEWRYSAMSADGQRIVVGMPSGILYVSSDGGTSWDSTDPTGGAETFGWNAVSTNADRSIFIATGSEGIYVSPDGIDWTEVTTSFVDISDTVAMSADGQGILVGTSTRLYGSVNGGADWSETGPTVGEDHEWKSITMSADGQHIIAGARGERLYVTTDGGATWGQIGPTIDSGDASQYWTIDMNAAGNRLVAGVDNGSGHLFVFRYVSSEWTWSEARILSSVRNWTCSSVGSDGTHIMAGTDKRLYVSSNSGATWTETRPVGDTEQYWIAVGTSTDGSRLIAGVDLGGLYTSVDGGGHWTLQRPGSMSDTESWGAAAISSDGSRLIAGAYGGGLFTSSLLPDGSTEWTDVTPSGNETLQWSGASISADGTRIVAGEWGGGLYTSVDSGEHWTLQQPGTTTATEDWTAVSVSADGSSIIAGQDGGRLYAASWSSEDAVVWREVRPVGDTDQDWISMSVDADGSQYAVATNYGRLYVSTDSGNVWNEERPIDGSDITWTAALSGDGSLLVAGAARGEGLRIGTSGADPEPINIGPTAEKFREDILFGFISIGGSDPTDTSTVTFNVDYTIIAGDATIVFPAGTVMTRTGGGSLDFTEMTMSDISASLRNGRDGTVAGAVELGIPDLRLSFSTPITVTIPVGSGYEGRTLLIYYQDAGETAWSGGLSCTVSDGKCVFETDHATKYSAGDDPSGTVSGNEKAKVDSWKAYLRRRDSKCATKLILEVKGRHFDDDVEVRIGGKTASKVDRKSNRELTATFCYSKLVAVKTDLERTITVMNPDADPTKAKHKIDLGSVSGGAAVSDLDPSTTEGIANIQRTLVGLGLLSPEHVTGTYGPLTTAAVRAFQANNGLPQTGFVGPLTRAKLAGG